MLNKENSLLEATTVSETEKDICGHEELDSNDQKTENIRDEEKFIKEFLNLEYRSIEDFPELTETVDIVSDEMNKDRRKYGLPKIDYKYSDIRLISEDKFDNTQYAKITRDESGDDLTGYAPSSLEICFIRFNEKKYNTSRSESLEAKSCIIHECAHKGIDERGIANYSGNLNEGFVEKKAREIMERRIILNIFKIKDYENRKKCASFQFMEYNNNLYSKDILIWDKNKEDDGFDVKGFFRPYILEVEIVEKIKKVYPELYKDLLECCFRGDSEGAERLIENTCGKEVAELLKNGSKTTYGQIFDKIEESKKSFGN